MNGIEKNDIVLSPIEMAIVVVSYDGYSDLWDDYFNLLNKYWSDRPYPVYLANNTKKPEYKHVSVINCGEEAQWSTRVRIALEKIKEPYICLLVEDYLTGANVDTQVICETLKFIKNEGIKYYKLTNNPNPRVHYKNIKYLYAIPEKLEYGVSLQAAIWERKYLLDLLGDGDYTAWKFELNQVSKTTSGSSKLISDCVSDDRNILQICHGVVQGKWLPSAIKYFKSQNYQLNTSKRTVMTQRDFFIYSLKNSSKAFIPNKARKIVKGVLKKVGMEFVSDKYKG